MLDSQEHTRIRVEELQKRLDSDLMRDITAKVWFIICPQGKLSPEIKNNNFGFILATNLLNLVAEVNLETWIIDVDKKKILNNYLELMTLMANEFNVKNNLTFYPLFLIEPSNSSKFVHGLPYVEINNKWNNEDEFNQESDKLKAFIEGFRDKIHIDENLEIVSTKVVNWQVLIRFKVDSLELTMLIGYSTKHEKFDINGVEIEFIDWFGNIFSQKNDADQVLTDEELRISIEKAHSLWAKYMTNYYSWRSPEYVTEDNYKNFYYHEIDNKMSDEEGILAHKWVLYHFSNWLRVVVENVHGGFWNFLAHTQDQLMPDYWDKDWSPEEIRKFNYWHNVYIKKFRHHIDLGVDSFRIDLAHGFGKKNFDLFKWLIRESIEYADIKYNKNINFVLETYDNTEFWGTKPAEFRDWNCDLPFPAVKVYHKDIEEEFSKLKDDWTLRNLMKTLKFLLQDIRGVNWEMMALTTFDDHTLFDIAKKSGIAMEHILELQILLWKTGFNILSLDRDFQWLQWELIPTAPGWHEKFTDSWIFDTHNLLRWEELMKFIKSGAKIFFKESVWFNVLSRIRNLPDVTGLTIDDSNYTIIFTFEDNSQRIFNLEELRDWSEPYTVESAKKIEMLDVDTYDNLLELECLERELPINSINKNLDSFEYQLEHVYKYKFRSEFAAYVCYFAYEKEWIQSDENEKQYAYFMLNRNRLIKDFLSMKGIIIWRKNSPKEFIDWELSANINRLRKLLELRVSEIIKKNVHEDFPDLI